MVLPVGLAGHHHRPRIGLPFPALRIPRILERKPRTANGLAGMGFENLFNTILPSLNVVNVKLNDEAVGAILDLEVANVI